MRITKYGHSCLYIEEGEARILIDPGTYTFKDVPLRPEDLPECNILLLTHSHPDHTDPDALKIILQKSTPVILANTGVWKMLREHGIESEVFEHGEERIIDIRRPSLRSDGGSASRHSISIRAVSCDHGFIAEHIPRPENVGFLIGGRLFHPGDCVAPAEAVQAEILAVPVVAPWMAVREGLEFVKKVKPRVAIPIHDAMVKWPEAPWYKIFQTGLEGTGIEFIPMKIGEVREF